MEPLEAYARYKFGILSSDSIVSLANLWLNKGMYTESLCELSGVINPIMSDVGPLFEEAILELKVEEISRVDAAKVLIKNTLQRIIDGKIDLLEGAEFLYWQVHNELVDELPDNEHVGDSLNLENIFCWLREIWDCKDGSILLYYTDIPRDQAELKFREHLIEESKKWIENNINA